MRAVGVGGTSGHEPNLEPSRECHPVVGHDLDLGFGWPLLLEAIDLGRRRAALKLNVGKSWERSAFECLTRPIDELDYFSRRGQYCQSRADLVGRQRRILGI
jgi:hypothetical protein